jgi:hypothetical protein
MLPDIVRACNEKKRKRSVAPHLLCHRPAYVQIAHFAGLFRAFAVLLDAYKKSNRKAGPAEESPAFPSMVP